MGLCTQNDRGINSRCSKLLVSAFICIFGPHRQGYQRDPNTPGVPGVRDPQQKSKKKKFFFVTLREKKFFFFLRDFSGYLAKFSPLKAGPLHGPCGLGTSSVHKVHKA